MSKVPSAFKPNLTPEDLEKIFSEDEAIKACHRRIAECRAGEERRVKKLQEELSVMWAEAAKLKVKVKEAQAVYKRYVGTIKVKQRGQKFRLKGQRIIERRIEIRKRVIKNKLQRQAVAKAKENFRKQFARPLSVAGLA